MGRILLVFSRTYLRPSGSGRPEIGLVSRPDTMTGDRYGSPVYHGTTEQQDGERVPYIASLHGPERRACSTQPT
jgi:hypothetical protein